MTPSEAERKPHISNQVTVSRLTALWALHEAGLGGLLHLFYTSFEGIIMAGFATVLITLISHFGNRNQSVLFRSLILVMITKIIASPHSGFPAFMAVLFQGVLGMVLFKRIKSLRVAAIMLGILAFVETALQRMLLIALMFGKSLFDSLDIFIAQIGLSFGYNFQNGGLWIFSLYLLIYLISGVLFGSFSYYLAKNINSTIVEEYKNIRIDDRFIAMQQTFFEGEKVKKSANFSVYETIIIGSVISVILVFLSPQSNGWQTVLYTFLRCISFVILWFFILNPILVEFFRAYFSKKQSKYQGEVEDIFEFMSTLRKLVRIAWQETENMQGIKKIKAFVRKTIAFTLLYESFEVKLDNEN